MSGHVFISHGSDDREEANALSAFLEGRSVRTWIAPRDVRPGMDYSEALQAAIESCLAFVVLVTETSNKSPYVRAETEMAFSGHKPILPVRNSDIKPAAGLAFFLKIRHWTDAYGPGREDSLERLARELQTLSGVAPDAAAEPPAPVTQPAPPPAPPVAGAPPAPPQTGDQELLAAAIGPNADYFLRHWAAMDATGKSYDWNWAACFLNFCWFAYRRMWLPAVGIGLVYVVTTPLLDPTDKMLFRATAFFVVGLSFVTGAFANKLYRNQIERLVAGTADMSREDAIDHVRRRGGTSVPGLVVSILAILVLGMLVALASAMQKAAANPALTAAAAPEPGNGATGTPVLDQNYLVGRWTDDGDCSRAYEFTADGRFIAADGGVGSWRLDGDQLTASGPAGSATLRVAPVDQNAISATSPDGGSGTSTRC
jgi:hypothetical protein